MAHWVAHSMYLLMNFFSLDTHMSLLAMATMALLMAGCPVGGASQSIA